MLAYSTIDHINRERRGVCNTAGHVLLNLLSIYGRCACGTCASKAREVVPGQKYIEVAVVLVINAVRLRWHHIINIIYIYILYIELV